MSRQVRIQPFYFRPFFILPKIIMFSLSPPPPFPARNFLLKSRRSRKTSRCPLFCPEYFMVPLTFLIQETLGQMPFWESFHSTPPPFPVEPFSTGINFIVGNTTPLLHPIYSPFPRSGLCHTDIHKALSFRGPTFGSCFMASNSPQGRNSF